MNLDNLKSHLQCPTVPIDILPTVTSTNDTLLAQLSEASVPSVLLSDHQTQGRGRRSRDWHTPPGSGLALSLSWSFSHPMQTLSGLSMAVGVMVIRALEALGVKTAQLKWPNDILIDGNKLSGILIDLEQQSDQVIAVIGIGVNVDLPIHLHDEPWTDLHRVAGNTITLERLAAELINQLLQDLPVFASQQLSPFLPTWQRHDALMHKVITFTLGDRMIEGEYQGISPLGELRLLHDGAVHHYHSGDVHLSYG